MPSPTSLYDGCTCRDCRSYGCDHDCGVCNAPDWFLVALEAGAVSTETGPDVYALKSADGDRWIDNDDPDGAMLGGYTDCDRCRTFTDADDAVSWLLTNPSDPSDRGD